MKIRERIFEIVEPRYNSQDSIQTRVYDWCMLIAIAIGILPLMFREQTRLFYLFDLISCALFIIDYLLSVLSRVLISFVFLLLPVHSNGHY